MHIQYYADHDFLWPPFLPTQYVKNQVLLWNDVPAMPRVYYV